MINRREALQHVGTIVLSSMSLGMAFAEEKSTSRTKAPQPRIKVGQIGTGHAHAMRTLMAHRESADFEVVGIVEPNEELRKQAMTLPAYQDLKWMTQEQLLNTADLQAVLVETKIGGLLDAAEACVKAGKHVHIDKPAGESLPQFKRILDSAAQKKLLVQMGYVYRYNPAIVLLRDFIRRGWLGEIFEVEAAMGKTATTDQRKKLAEFRGGILFELGGHIIDVVVEILGKPMKVTPFNQHASSVDDKLVDNMMAVLSYPRSTATVKSNTLGVEGNKRRYFTVCGTEGTFHIESLDSPTAKITLSKAQGRYKAGTQDVKFPEFARYVTDAAEMARVIRKEKEMEFSYDHDLAVQTTLLEACGLPLDK